MLDETRPAQLILMHVWYALWGWETYAHMYTYIHTHETLEQRDAKTLSHTNIMAAL